MRKDKWTVPAFVMEAAGIVLGLIYICLQIYYGIYYGVSPMKIVMNLLVAVLVYAMFTMLAIYPERIHGLMPEMCTGDVRKYSIRMVRIVKFIFIASLLIPCVFDIIGIELHGIVNLVVIVMILAVIIYYEYRIIKILRRRK